MKKIISLMTAVCMLVLCGSALAVELNWEDFADQVAEAGWEGQWVANEEWNAGFFLPDAFQEAELTQEQIDQGGLAVYKTADGSAAFIVMYVELPEEATDAETYAAALQELGYSDAEVDIINGYEMVTYTDTDNDQLVAMSVYDDGTAMVFDFMPASDEGLKAVASIMMASLLTYDEAVAMAQ